MSTADGPGVDRVHGVLGVDVGTDAAVALPLGHDVHGQGRLPRGLGSVELDDPAPGQPTDTEGQVEGHGAGGNGLDGHVHPLAHAHDRALAELLLDVPDRHIERLVTFHRIPSRRGGWIRASPYGWGVTITLLELQECSSERMFGEAFDPPAAQPSGRDATTS